VRHDPVVEAEELIDGRATGSPTLFHEATCWPALGHPDHDWRELRRGFLSAIRPLAAE
jgi:hypothetical protein